MKSFSVVLKGAPFSDFFFLLEHFSAHVGNNRKTWRDWIGNNGLPDLKPSGVLLLDFCAKQLINNKYHVRV